MPYSKGDPAAIAGGQKGGKAKNPNKGFGANKELARIVGQKGGRISRRKKRELK